jgi:RNA polymerase sigma-70 factor (ECF subfamily)
MDSDRIEKILAKAIEALPNQQRMVFHYRYYDDLSFKQISTILGISQGGLKANYHHAVAKIKKKLGLY